MHRFPGDNLEAQLLMNPATSGRHVCLNIFTLLLISKVYIFSYNHSNVYVNQSTKRWFWKQIFLQISKKWWRFNFTIIANGHYERKIFPIYNTTLVHTHVQTILGTRMHGYIMHKCTHTHRQRQAHSHACMRTHGFTYTHTPAHHTHTPSLSSSFIRQRQLLFRHPQFRNSYQVGACKDDRYGRFWTALAVFASLTYTQTFP